jgi:type I restriction enzyme R subunit
MTTVGQREKATQQRVVSLFRDTLRYRYLGDWEKRENNRNIEPDLLFIRLKQHGHSDALIGKALYELEKAAGDTSKSLYDRNRAVYDLLRYGVKVRPDVGENMVTVWLVDGGTRGTTISPLPRKWRWPRPTPRPTTSARTSCCT